MIDPAFPHQAAATGTSADLAEDLVRETRKIDIGRPGRALYFYDAQAGSSCRANSTICPTALLRQMSSSRVSSWRRRCRGSRKSRSASLCCATPMAASAPVS